MDSLFDQFAREDATPYARELIRKAVCEHKAHLALELKTFEFNRFEVKLDFIKKVAVIEDDFDVSPSGTLQMPIDEFLRRLG